MPPVTATKYMIQAGWNDVPHLSEQAKRELDAGIMPHLRAARRDGTPSIGAGAIYPIDLDTLLIDPFQIPRYYRKVYGLDVGWNRTAGIFGALDADTDILYLYSEHYEGQQIASVHATAIKARGAWIPGVIDPAAHGRAQKDGTKLIEEYRAKPSSLRLFPADNAVEAGLQAVWDRMVTGRLKVFRSLMNWQHEVKLYRRDEDGKIVKKADHLMDATRYLVVSGIRYATTEPMAAAQTKTGPGNKIVGY